MVKFPEVKHRTNGTDYAVITEGAQLYLANAAALIATSLTELKQDYLPTNQIAFRIYRDAVTKV